MRILVPPVKSHLGNGGNTLSKSKDNMLMLQEELKKRNHTWSVDENDLHNTDVRKLFAQTSMKLLLELQENLLHQLNFGEKSELELLSIQDQGIVRTLLELIVCWGIIPCLKPGVGLPISRRSTIIKIAFELEVDYTSSESTLLEYVRGLMSILQCSQKTEIFGILATRHLTDIFAALLQLSHSHNDNTTTQQQPTTVSPQYATPASITLINTQKSENGVGLGSELSDMDRKYCSDSIQFLAESVSAEFVIESLFQLLSVPNAPKWSQKFVSVLLTNCLMRPHGIRVILERMVLGNGDQEVSPKAVERAIQLIVTPPQSVPKTTYFEKISPHLIHLLHSDRSVTVGSQNDTSKKAKIIVSVIELIIGRLVHRQKEHVTKCLLGPIMSPFKVFIEEHNTSERTVSEVVVSEEELSQSVNDIEKLAIGNPPPYQQSILEALTPIMSSLFQLYCFTSKTTISNLRSSIQKIVAEYFRWSDRASFILKSFIVPINKDNVKLLVSTDYQFSAGSGGGVVIKKVERSKRDLYWEAQCALQLLKDINNEGLTGDLFIDLFNEFTQLKKKSLLPDENLDMPHNADEHLILLHVLILLSENFGATILKNFVQLATLIKVLLEDKSDQETIILSLGLLMSLMSGSIKFKKEEEFLIFDLLPDLEELSGFEEEEIKSVAVKLVKKINDREDWTEKDHEANKGQSEFQYDLDAILKDLNDPLISSRAYALITLRKVVLSKDPVAKENLFKFLDIFQKQIQDQESFIYLNAIKGLSALGDIYPNEVIPKLLESFMNRNLDELARLKIGEALLLISKRCGEMLPKYANYFMNGFLFGSKDPLPSIRASSLSNLAELCKQLHFALHSYIRDIMECINSILNTEKEAEVRRGGVFVATLLFKGLGKDIFEMIPDDLKLLYRLLKRLQDSDPDEVTRFHAQLALSELNETMREFFSGSSIESSSPSILQITK